MISIKILFILLFTHWVGDYAFQTEKMGINKSHNAYWLFTHVVVYSTTMYIALILIHMSNALPINLHIGDFITITFVLHFFTDYVSSRISKHCYMNKHMYGISPLGFWPVIGLDQLVHIVTLVVTYKICQY